MCISISSTIRDYYFFDDENMPAGQPSQFFLENDTLAWNSIEVQNKVSFCFVH